MFQTEDPLIESSVKSAISLAAVTDVLNGAFRMNPEASQNDLHRLP
jgi:hypothetical protein